MTIRARIANPSHARKSSSSPARAKQLPLRMPSSPPKKAGGSRIARPRPSTARHLRSSGAKETQANLRALAKATADAKAEAAAEKKAWAEAKRDLARLKAEKKREERKARSPKKKAAKTMAKAKKRGGKAKAKTSGKRKKGARRKAKTSVFRYPKRVTVTRRRKNPSFPEAAKIVGGTLLGSAVAAGAVIGTSKAVDHFKLGKGAQIATLLGVGIIGGGALALLSPAAAAAAALPMFATAGGLATGAIAPRQLTTKAGGEGDGVSRGLLSQMGEVRRLPPRNVGAVVQVEGIVKHIDDRAQINSLLDMYAPRR